MIPESIFIIVTAATTIIKIVVDVIRMGFPVRPSWVSPMLAICTGPIVVMLIMLSNGSILTIATAAQAIIAGILAGGTAIGVTEAQKRAS